MILQLVKELVDLSLPDLHICVTSRPEIDIRNVLEPLTSRRVSLHDQSGQRQDIERLCSVCCLLRFATNHEEMEDRRQGACD